MTRASRNFSLVCIFGALVLAKASFEVVDGAGNTVFMVTEQDQRIERLKRLRAQRAAEIKALKDQRSNLRAERLELRRERLRIQGGSTPTTRDPRVPTTTTKAPPTTTTSVIPPTPAPTAAPVAPLPPPTAAGNFKIALVNMGTDTQFDLSMRKAADRWENVIYGDLQDIPPRPDANADWFNGVFGEGNSYNEAVDDVVIGYRFINIDGPGRVLGRAAPLFRRLNGGNGDYSTVSGMMEFDSSDFSRYPVGDREAIMAHEIGHVLGVGGVSRQKCASQCTASTDGGLATNSEYNPELCPNAGAQAIELGLINNANELNLERIGTRGSACSHIEDLAGANEPWSDLMTARFNPNKIQLLTKIDLGALIDLGGYSDIQMDRADDISSVNQLSSGANLTVEAAKLNYLHTERSFVLHHDDSGDGMTPDTIYIDEL